MFDGVSYFPVSEFIEIEIRQQISPKSTDCMTGLISQFASNALNDLSHKFRDYTVQTHL